MKQLLDFKNFVLPYLIIVAAAVLATALSSLWAYDYGFSTGSLVATQENITNQQALGNTEVNPTPPPDRVEDCTAVGLTQAEIDYCSFLEVKEIDDRIYRKLKQRIDKITSELGTNTATISKIRREYVEKLDDSSHSALEASLYICEAIEGVSSHNGSIKPLLTNDCRKEVLDLIEGFVDEYQMSADRQ